LLGRLDRTSLERLVIDVAGAAKPRRDPLVDPLNDPLKLGGIHGASRVKLHALLGIAREDAVDKRHMQVKIQIEAPAESLKERDSSPFVAPLISDQSLRQKQDHMVSVSLADIGRSFGAATSVVP